MFKNTFSQESGEKNLILFVVFNVKSHEFISSEAKNNDEVFDLLKENFVHIGCFEISRVLWSYHRPSWNVCSRGSIVHVADRHIRAVIDVSRSSATSEEYTSLRASYLDTFEEFRLIVR